MKRSKSKFFYCFIAGAFVAVPLFSDVTLVAKKLFGRGGTPYTDKMPVDGYSGWQRGVEAKADTYSCSETVTMFRPSKAINSTTSRTRVGDNYVISTQIMPPDNGFGRAKKNTTEYIRGAKKVRVNGKLVPLTSGFVDEIEQYDARCEVLALQQHEQAVLRLLYGKTGTEFIIR